MPANYLPTSSEYIRILPEIILTVLGVIIMLMEAVFTDAQKKIYPYLTFAGLLAAIGGTIAASNDPGFAFQNMLVIDGYATFFRFIVLGVGLLTVLGSAQYLERAKANTGEYWGLILFSIVGQSLMATSNELIMIFIGLEISSIATYILAGYLRDDRRNNESALKYFLLGSFATAFFLYGVAWIYGMTGFTNLTEIRRYLLTADLSNSIVLVGSAAALMFVGFAFKISAAPFQVWAPDVYQGAPAPVTAFMSAGPKAAAFAILTRVFLTAFGPISDRWEPIFWVVALATMIVGNFAALRQTNIKRMLAYSSIAHAGYILVAITCHTAIGTAASMFYLASYAFMNVGAFAVVTHLARKDEQYVEIDDLAGLAQRQPMTAAMMTIFLLSFIGVPLTGGFFGKFYIFKAALDSQFYWLTVLGLLNSAVAAYYYLRVLVVMYMKDPGESTESLEPLSGGLLIAVGTSALATLVLGIFPSLVLDVAIASSNFVK